METSSCTARIQARKAPSKKLKMLSFQPFCKEHTDSVRRTDIHNRLIYKIHEMVPKLSSSIGPLFYLELRPSQQAVVRCTEIGKLLVSIAAGNFPRLRADWPVHKFSYLVRGVVKFLEILLAWTYRMKANFNMALPLEIAKKTMDLANRFALALKRHFKRSIIKSAQESFSRSARDNFEELIGILQWISEKHSKAIVLRFDTGYLEEGAKPHKFGDPPRLAHLDEYRKCRARLHRWIKSRFGGDLLLCTWALEYGREKAFHHHYLVVLKPSGNGDHVGLVEEIGRKWSAITKSRGSIYNSNAQRNTYRYSALGLVRLDHPDVIIGLRYIVSYITLEGIYVSLDLGRKVRAHDKFGNYPKDLPIKQLAQRSLSSSRPIPIATTFAQAQSRYVNFL